MFDFSFSMCASRAEFSFWPVNRVRWVLLLGFVVHIGFGGSFSSHAASLEENLRLVAEYELRFVTLVCQLPADAIEPLSGLVLTKASQISKELAAAADGNDGRVVQRGFRFQKGVAAVIHPLAHLRQSIYDVILQNLSDPNKIIYQYEYAAQEDFLANAITSCLLQRLHTRLRLSQLQQTALSRHITEWAQNYVHLSSTILGQDELIPSLPETFMYTHLDADQRAVWAGLPKSDLNHIPCETEIQARFH